MFNFAWDNNGNMIQRSNTTLDGTYRSLCWDEENRLMSVTDFEDGGNFSTTSAYVYNAGGERVWKFAGQIERMSLNGDLYVDVAQMSSRTLYANPYLVATDQQYTKHYFIETERIASKLGGGFGMVDNPVDQYFAIAPLEGSLEDHSDNLQQHIINSFSCSADVELGADIILHGIEDFADLDDAEEELYFTHSDHLGSSSFITDASGEAVQRLQYLPFGESFVTQTSSGWESRYTFSGKEKDVETGYSYFGARYYDSDLSVWLSVDPLSDMYPSTSGYMYVRGNPIILMDPDGRADKRFWIGKRFVNWVSGDNYKNKANKFAVKNNLNSTTDDKGNIRMTRTYVYGNTKRNENGIVEEDITFSKDNIQIETRNSTTAQTTYSKIDISKFKGILVLGSGPGRDGYTVGKNGEFFATVDFSELSNWDQPGDNYTAPEMVPVIFDPIQRTDEYYDYNRKKIIKSGDTVEMLPNRPYHPKLDSYRKRYQTDESPDEHFKK